jgi:hypothetical protein
VNHHLVCQHASHDRPQSLTTAADLWRSLQRWRWIPPRMVQLQVRVLVRCAAPRLAACGPGFVSARKIPLSTRRAIL